MQDHMGKHQGQSGGRRSKEKACGGSLYFGFHGNGQARQGKQG